jgi:hypothetical protein
MPFMKFAPSALAVLSLVLVFSTSSCSMFGSKPVPQASTQQEFDPMTSSWKPSSRVVVPPPSQPAAPIAVTAEAEPEKPGLVKKMTGWLPFVD